MVGPDQRLTRSEDEGVSPFGAGQRLPLSFFFGTRAQPCPYLDGRMENKVVTDLSGPYAQSLHDELTASGYRRSHNLAYRQACIGCDACVPVRIPVARFRPGRSMRRTWRINADLAIAVTDPVASLEQYDLFDRYQNHRHEGGGMSRMAFPDYRAMVEESPVATRLVEARDRAGDLIAVSLTDFVADGLSGIYKFFDPDQPRRSLGTFLILWHVEHALAQGFQNVYLGYWIAGCTKMEYKARFQPLEALGPDGWRPLEPEDT